MANKFTSRLSTTTPRTNLALLGANSSDPAVQALFEAARKRQEEEEKKKEAAAKAVSQVGNVGLNRAMSALPGSGRLTSTNPTVQAALDRKYAREDAELAAWDARRKERQEARKKELEAAGGYYATLPQKSDWAAYSAARDDVKDKTYRYINASAGERDLIDVPENASVYSGYFNDRLKYRYMTDDEIKTYNYLYNKNKNNSVGTNVASDYLAGLSRTLEERQAKAETEKAKEFAQKNPVTATIASAASVPDNLVGGMRAAGDIVSQNVKKLFTGENVNYNSRAQQLAKSAETVRGTVADNIDSPVWKFLYQTGMSAADSLAAGVFGPLAGSTMLGASAGASAARDAHERGASDEEALLTGVLAATAEALFERISIGNLKGLKDVPVTGIKSVAKNVAKSMAVNASEEALTEIANTVSDLLVMGDMSNYALLAQDYVAQGMSESEAKKKAARDVAGQILMSGLAGGVMGTAFGGIGSVQSAFQNSRTGKAIAQTGNPQEVLDAGMGMEEGSDARKFAEKLTAKQEAGQTLRNSEIGALHRENVMQIKNALDTVTRLGKAFGRQVHFYEDEDAEQGGYAENGEIYLNTRAPQQMMAQFFTHELTHTAESAEAYNLLAADIRGRLGDSMAEMKQRKIERYAQKGTNLTDAGAEAEVIADYVAKNLFTNESEIQRLVKRNRNAALRVYDRIREWSAKVNGDTEKEFLLRAQRLYEKALRETRGQTGESGRKEYLSPSFKEQFEEWYTGNDEGNRKTTRFYVGATSNVLKSLGVPDYPIYFHSKKIEKIMRDHSGMTADIIEQIPEIIENPLLVMRSKTFDSRLTMFGELHDMDGKPVLAVLEMYPTNRYGEIQDFGVIASAYGKDNASAFVESSEVIYQDTKRANGLEQIRLQLPSISVDRGSFNNIIADHAQNVNTQGETVTQSQQSGRQMAFTDESDEEMIDLYGRAMPDFVKDNREAVNREVAGVLSYAITDKDDAYLQDRFGDSLGEYAQAGSTVRGMLEETEAFERIRDRLGDFYNFDQKFNAALAAQMLVQAKRDGYIEQGKNGTVALTEKGLEYAFGGNVPEWVGKLRQDYVKGEIRKVARPMRQKADVKETGNETAKRNQGAEKENESASRHAKGFDELLSYIDTIPDSEKREAARAELMAREEELDAYYRDRELAKENKLAKGEERTEAVVPETESQKRSEDEEDLLQYAEETTESVKKEYSGEMRDRMDRTEYISQEMIAAMDAQKRQEKDAWRENARRRYMDELLDYVDSVDTEKSGAEDFSEREKDIDAWYQERAESGDLAYDPQGRMRSTADDYIKFVERAKAEAAERKQNPEALITTEVEKTDKTIREKGLDAWRFFKRKMVDSGEAVDRLGNALGDKSLYSYYNMARASSNAGISMIMDAQTDVKGRVVGESLNSIFDPIIAKGDGYYAKVQSYLYHRHNIDRMNRTSGMVRTVEEAREALADFNEHFPEFSRMTQEQVRRIARDESDMMSSLAEDYLNLTRAVDRAEAIKDKPVFGYEITADDSQMEAERLLRENPELEVIAERVYKYIDNLMQYRLQSGLISAELYLKLKEIYPHYVPTFRVQDKTAVQKNKENSVQIGKTIGRAEGSHDKLKPLHKALAEQTLSVVREGSKNRFGLKLLSDVERSKTMRRPDRNVDDLNMALKEENAPKALQHEVIEISEYENPSTVDSFDMDEDAVFKRGNTFIIREGDRMWQMTVSDALYEAVKVLSPDTAQANAVTKIVRKGNDMYKRMITGWNPTFAVKNFLRDLQDAGLYAGNAADFIKKYPKAWKEISTNGELWQQYKAMGGTYSSFFDYDTGTAKKRGTLSDKTMGRVEAANMAIEQAPRFAEFMSTRERLMKERGETEESLDTLMESMLAAADITTNFGRAGTWGKMLNQNYIPFLNPGIQGFDKLVRTVTGKKSAQEWARLAAAAAVFGIAPTLINALVYGDDEEYDNLKARDKDVYYLFKVGDGNWLKLPKGRATSLFGMAVNMTIDAAEGRDIDVKDRLSTASSQVAPANPLEENILRAWFDADLFDEESPGKTWYGGDIESQRLQNYAPEERYDEKTDELSKLIGRITKLSPKKINYLIDSYSGVVGDILLPLLSPQTKQFPLASTFLLDGTASNRLNNDFYEKMNKLTYAKNKPDATGLDTIMYRFWNKQASAVSDINAAIREVESDADLRNYEKKQLVRAQYDLRNAAQKEAEQIYDQYLESATYWYNRAEGTEEERIDYAYRQANYEVLGADYALKAYNSATYEKAQRMNTEGVSYDHFYYMQFTAKQSAEGAEIYDNEMRDRIADLNASQEEKMALYRGFISTSRENEISAVLKSGMSFDDFLQIQNAYARANDVGTDAEEKRSIFASWVRSNNYSQAEMNVINDTFVYYFKPEIKTKRSTSGISMPTMPEIKLPEVKLPAMPQINLPNFGG